MGEAFGDVDVSQVIYLLLYLFLVIGGLSSMPRAQRPRAKAPVCGACQTPIGANAVSRGPWGGWTCAACGAGVDPVIEPPPRTGLRGWMDEHPWAIGGAVWGLLIWGLMMGGAWWKHVPPPTWATLPLAVLAGFGIGWVLSLKARRS